MVTSIPVEQNGPKASVVSDSTPLSRADEVQDLLNAVQELIIPFIAAADRDAGVKGTGHGLRLSPGSDAPDASRTVLVEHLPPKELVPLLNFSLPDAEGLGKSGLLEIVSKILQYSVNTWDQGFLDKLYASTNAVGVVAELLLATLNTNLHVYQVSPALSVIEKTTTRAFANLFGFNGPHAGGFSTQGGSAANATSLVIARGVLYPETKDEGNADHKFVVFTSAHGHYSMEKAAQMCGIGSKNVWPVPVDDSGRMIPSALDELAQKAKAQGYTPLYVNATAGTTVFGSYDPFPAVREICDRYNMWMHVDGSWGGPAIFAPAQKHKLAGAELADSLTVNPHKMLAAPVTCSFLLGRDVRLFHKANTLRAGYLFHDSDEDEVWDLADMTLQCGRRGDSLKLALSWIYYGRAGLQAHVENAFEMASRLADLVSRDADFVLVSQNPPPCLQVCFYYTPGGQLSEDKETNTQNTKRVAAQLLRRGFMVDYAPGEMGSFFRVVVNVQTRRETVEGLVKAFKEIGRGEA